ncbi:benzoylsuccinyl-CoA thiolase BbsB subunit [Desulfocicer vacuolatum DSM 3385]|uniref:propanoyl-CoA C-acyltransferase n=1 Tax=Desulfocicer vacuolatum DSM 3385 TaxID=1121400 RepID=A0A1W2CXM5_9BACT|nr:thiolase family protein [Desulfocicer vacuolatum]SMC89644.1 benzoylsuccinyl-CoA thiolase BbsB subunit [Desulfocicer vacuolatum DSM 3385]
MRDVYTLGTGQTIFGKHDNKTVNELGAAAAMAAVRDAEILPKELQTAYCGNIYGPANVVQSTLIRLGIGKIPMYTVENACASGSSAVHLLHRDIAYGVCDIGIALGVESLSAYNKKFGKGLIGIEGDMQAKLSLTMPSFFAMLCNRLMEERGATLEDICYPSIKNHKNGVTNPFSQYKKEVTFQQIMDSPMIADPITLLQCCPQSDGAAAVILCSKEYYKKFNQKTQRPAVKVAASVISVGSAEDSSCDPLAQETNIRSAIKACEIAGVEAGKDIDVVEMHDAFSGEELSAYEMLGLCPKGEGVAFARAGAAAMGGRCPVNPSGGLLSMGHPLGASGVRVVADIARQLWGEAGTNQVEGAKVGMAQMLGGVLSGVDSPVVAGIQILTK